MLYPGSGKPISVIFMGFTFDTEDAAKKRFDDMSSEKSLDDLIFQGFINSGDYTLGSYVNLASNISDVSELKAYYRYMTMAKSLGFNADTFIVIFREKNFIGIVTTSDVVLDRRGGDILPAYMDYFVPLVTEKLKSYE